MGIHVVVGISQRVVTRQALGAIYAIRQRGAGIHRAAARIGVIEATGGGDA